jgi:hypothetical protein
MEHGGQRRDRGFRNVRSATKWLAAGAAGLIGLFTAVAAHSTTSAASNRKTSIPPTPTTAAPAGNDTSPSTSPSTQPGDDGSGDGNSLQPGPSYGGDGNGNTGGYDNGGGGLQAPTSPPIQSDQPPVASSGGT